MRLTGRHRLHLLTCAVLLAGCSTPPGNVPSSALRPNPNPSQAFELYLVAFHPMLDDPLQQMEAHHYCHQKSPDLAQCVLFDSNLKDANMVGVEYIISEAMFTTLTPDDQKDWHPHNFEILSGQLRAPGIPEVAEHALMKTKMNSYGKTWHFWNTTKGEKLPTGIPSLAWSFNHDGEIRPGLVEDLDSRTQTNSAEKRQKRQDLVQDAHPQSGVERLDSKAFGRPTTPIPGVQDSNPQK